MDPQRGGTRLVDRPGSQARLLTEIVPVTGEGPVEGFVLNLPPVWDPLQ